MEVLILDRSKSSGGKKNPAYSQMPSTRLFHVSAVFLDPFSLVGIKAPLRSKQAFAFTGGHRLTSPRPRRANTGPLVSTAHSGELDMERQGHGIEPGVMGSRLSNSI